MSHTRYVKGKIVKRTAGMHNMYAKESIVFNAENNINEWGEGGGTRYGEPEEAPKTKVPVQCEINFRPSRKWQGEFGFDWNRIADSKMLTDFKYENILGKYGKIYATEPEAVFTNINSEYQRHEGNYNSFYSFEGKYHVPKMTLMKDRKAVLDAVINVKEKPDKLHFAYNSTLFEINILQTLTTDAGRHYNSDVIEIKCKEEFNTIQSIRLIATKNGLMKKVGELNVLPNNKREYLNAIFIPVKYKNLIGAQIPLEQELLDNALKQSYIDVNIETYPQLLEVSGAWFWLFFTKNGKLDTSALASLHRYLDEAFFKIKGTEIYKKYYRIYMLGQNDTLNGEAENIGKTKTVVVFHGGSTGRSKSTAAHELLHAMGLYHTFDNDGQFTFALHKTDNIMDYTHQVRGKERFSTNYWQWKVLNDQIK